MKNMIDNLIEVVGISNILPKYSRCFKQFQVQEIVCIPSEKPDMEQIMSISVDVIIIETSIISTPTAQSYEGQKLEGNKLLVRGKLVQKIEYIANSQLQPVHVAEFEKLFTSYIVLDSAMDCNQNIIVTPYVEDIYIKKINKREIFKNIMIFIDATSSVPDMSNSSIHDDLEENIVERHEKSKHCSHRWEEKRYFTQFVSMENITIPEFKPDIEQIISTIADPEIISMKVINTTKGLSCEGQYLSGKKIAVELKIKQKILYAAKTINQSMHGTENEYYESIYVVIPELIEGTDPEVLLKSKLLQPKMNVEDIFVVRIDKRNIFKNVTLMLEFCYTPTYEICYSSHENCTESNIFVMYENGSHNNQITHVEDCKCIKPVWSPDGQYIAYLSECNDKKSLNIMNIKNVLADHLTFPTRFHSIGSCCWSNDGRKLIFSAVEFNKKEIYYLDIRSSKIHQITKGHEAMKNYKPKCSPTVDKIAYLSLESKKPNLCVSDFDGLNMKQVTNGQCIMDFDWFKCGEKIACISGKGDKSDILISVDINCFDIKMLLNCDEISEKRCVRVSPDNRYIAFIGSICGKDCNDIYVYELFSKSVINLTQNSLNIKICDFVWKIDSSKIYYISNKSGHYNIYSISLMDFNKVQLTNSNAYNMQLSYRPRVK